MISIKQKVYNYLIDQISSGKLSAEERMPPESELCKIFSASRNTVRLAYNQLVHEGHVERKPGLGSFIVEKIETKPFHIGVIISGEHAFDSTFDPVAGELKHDIFNGILARAHETNTRISLVPVNSTWVPNGDIDGYAVIFLDLKVLQVLDKYHLPYSLCPIGTPPVGYSGVAIDFDQDFEECIEFLIDKGLRKIGLLDLDNHLYFASNAYKKIMGKYSLNCDDSYIELYSSHLTGSGCEAFVKLLERHRELDAVFFRTDIAALEALQYCHEVGIKVPDDISIIAYDNIPQTEQSQPKLTTYDPARHQVGYLALQQLEDKLNHIEYPNEITYISGKIIERNSVREK
jgi:DNA-binding LacI/PurR family transcriptional regulator